MKSAGKIVGQVLGGSLALLVAVGLCWGAPAEAVAEDECPLFTQDSFPHGQVWWRVKPGGDANEPRLADKPEGRTAYLVIAVRPDGILIQNRESRYPRLLSWKVVGRSLISVDGRRTWRAGCAP